MKRKVLMEVTKIEIKHDYQKKEDGSTDWSAPQLKVIYSTLQNLDNEENIFVTVTVPEKLEFGSLHQIILETEPFAKVVETERVSDAENADNAKQWP